MSRSPITRLVPALSSLAILACATMASAETLSPRDVAALPAPARELYAAGLEALDRLDRDTSARMLSDAARLAPESVPMQRLAAEQVAFAARLRSGEEAVALTNDAIAILDRLNSMPDIPNSERARILAQRGRLVARVEALQAPLPENGTWLALDFINEMRDRRLESRGITGVTNRDYDALVGRIPEFGLDPRLGEGDEEALTAADVWPERGAPGASPAEIAQVRREMIEQMIRDQQAAAAAAQASQGGGFGGGFGGEFDGGFGGAMPGGGFGGMPGGGFGGMPGGGFGGPTGGNPFGAGAAPGGNPFGAGAGAPGGNPFGGGATGGNPFDNTGGGVR